MIFRLFVCTVIFFFGLVAPNISRASSPEAWADFYRDVKAKCKATSGLINARIVGKVADSQNLGIVIVKGKRSKMNPEVVAELCLYDKKTHITELIEMEVLKNLK